MGSRSKVKSHGVTTKGRIFSYRRRKFRAAVAKVRTPYTKALADVLYRSTDEERAERARSIKDRGEVINKSTLSNRQKVRARKAAQRAKKTPTGVVLNEAARGLSRGTVARLAAAIVSA